MITKYLIPAFFFSPNLKYTHYLYELEVKHSHNVSTNNEKLKTDIFETLMHSKWKLEDNKMSMVKLIENEMKFS